jgi:hypothetical protein
MRISEWTNVLQLAALHLQGGLSLADNGFK